MRKALYFGAVLLVCSAMALAQDSNSTSSPSQSGSQATTTQNGTAGASAQTGTSADQSSSMSGQTFQGCLMGSNGNYSLTEAAGVTYQVQGDDSQLSANVNKQVEVMGTPGATASASAAGPHSDTSASAGSQTGSSGSQGNSTAQASATKTLNVTSIHKIADSCSNSQSPQ